MADEYWESSPFGEGSLFSPQTNERQRLEREQRQSNGEIVDVSVTKGNLIKEEYARNNKSDRLRKENYATPILNTPQIKSDLNSVTISISVSVKGYVESVYITVKGYKQRAWKLGSNFVAVFNLNISKKEGEMKIEIIAQIMDYIGNRSIDTKKMTATIHGDGKIDELSRLISIGNWYINHKTGEYVWFDKKEKRSGYTGVGYYKVIYDRDSDVLNIYAGKESIFIKALDMSKDISDKYKTDQAAKFALISAELGGSYVNNDDPTVQPLVIGASVDNRLKLYNLGIKQFSSDSTVQGLKGFQAMKDQSYKEFKYGNNKRYGDGTSARQKKEMNIGLSSVFTATLDTVGILNKYYSVPNGETKQFEQILYYAHGSGHTINGNFDVAIPEGTNDSFQYVRGDNKYKNMLSPEEEK